MYRLLVSDVDGTLVEIGMSPTSRVVEAIREANHRGLAVSLASGRSFGSLQGLTETLGITAPVICGQGGQIRDPVDGSVYRQVSLDRILAQGVVRLARFHGLQPTVHVDDLVYLDDLAREASFYHWAFGVPFHLVGDLEEVLARDPAKVLMIGEESQLDTLEGLFRRQFDHELQIVRSHAWFLEAVAAEVSKGNALQQVAHLLEVPQEAVVAVGDQDNDVSMIQWAGLGIAMGNAPPEVKAVADVVAPCVAEDGLAWAIELCLRAPCDSPSPSDALG